MLGLREDRLNVEFTQHSGDEMYHPTLGGYSPEWGRASNRRALALNTRPIVVPRANLQVVAACSPGIQ